MSLVAIDIKISQEEAITVEMDKFSDFFDWILCHHGKEALDRWVNNFVGTLVQENRNTWTSNDENRAFYEQYKVAGVWKQ
jgi:hypothetical protein